MTDEQKKEVVALRKTVIENEFSSLNNMQMKAACKITGPLLIFAGAGSGKTTVLVNRIANILRWGTAYESDTVYWNLTDDEMNELRTAAEQKTRLRDELVMKLSVNVPFPSSILAITFTNKAANELKSRICDKVGDAGTGIWASTFHSACGRILRANADVLGYDSHFTIYDTDDQKRAMTECMKDLKIDEKMVSVKKVMAEVSNAKNYLITPEKYSQNAGDDIVRASVAKAYRLYNERLKKANAMDFDDMIFNTVLLLRENPSVREGYGKKFRYIMVDEYQDTNHAQYELVRLLAEGSGNLCVVGDDDQSIYKFRGATIANILNFEKNFPDTEIIKLEQNYRSTKNILSAANSVIRNNTERKDKSLWTDKEQGSKLIRYNASDEHDEARFIVNTITEGVAEGAKYSAYAVLYRNNALSQNIEHSLVHAGIPYKLIGGRRFYERREVRDMVGYLSVISNFNDNARLKRIINVPKRGIGERTISQIEEIGYTIGESMFEVMRHCDEFEALQRSRENIEGFCRLIEKLAIELEEGALLSDVYKELVDSIKYEDFIRHESDHGDDAAENVRELRSSIVRYENEHPEDASLQGFLEEVSLLTDLDRYNNEENGSNIVLMTLHSSKGLEFENVFIPAMEENVFPGYYSTLSETEMQEERRLAYVGITRAKKRLYMICAHTRTNYGKTNYNKPSRFLNEIPVELVETVEKKLPKNYGAAAAAPGIRRREDMAQSRVFSSAAPQPKSTTASYTVGMTVKHRNFGEGMILNAKPMGSDTLLEIAFDKVGTKKLMANYANLEIVK